MEKIRQIDNYVIYQESDEDYKYYVVKSVSEAWKLTYRNDTAQYNIIDYFVYRDEELEAFSAVLGFWFLTTNVLLDGQLISEVTESIDALVKRSLDKWGDDEEVDDAGDKFVDEVMETVENGNV